MARPKLLEGRTPVQISALTFAIAAIFLGVAQFMGYSQSMQFTVVEALILFAGSLIVLGQAGYEGERTGLLRRDYSGTEIVSLLVGAGGVLIAVLALLGLAMGTTIVAVPSGLKTVIFAVVGILNFMEMLTE